MSRAAAVNAVLAALLVGLIAWLVVFAFRGAAAAPGSTPAEEVADEYTAITRAARSETIAFLTVDHENMDELIERVLDGATGAFKKQYQSSAKSLKDATESQKSVSKGRVDQIGLGEVDTDSASVFVSASSKVKNASTDGKTEDRSWRMKLTMSKEGDRWLVSQLEFVG